MIFKWPILLIVLAGLINGSFVVPAKFIKDLSNEKIWFIHSLIGVLIAPWLILLVYPGVSFYYTYLSGKMLFFLLMGGVVFGGGQLFFAYAIEQLGIALAFTINIGIGVTLGSLFVVFYRGLFFTTSGWLVVVATLLICISLLGYYFSSKNLPVTYNKAWLLASIAGICSGIQNIVFIIILTNVTRLHGQINNSFWIWPPFLAMAALVMSMGFAYRAKIVASPVFTLKIKDIMLIALMGICFTGSLTLYSEGVRRLPSHQQIIGWPLFMISIILVSQAWELAFKKAHQRKASLSRFVSVSLLLLAIGLLSVVA